tara:strand:- start:238 stop:1461 length:1224 start_codon:yes stop_codon:yes gene_type:complete
MSHSAVPARPLHPFRATLAAVCAIGIALGMSRYAYTPLIPALIRDGWVSVPQAGFLGGANCMGYLASCLLAIVLPRYLPIRSVIRLSLAIALIGGLMSAFDLGFRWLILARFVAGLSAAPLLVLTPSVLSSQISDRWKKVCSGIAFAGNGIFIVLISLTLPFFLEFDVQLSWLYEAAVTVVACILVWPLSSRASGKPLVRSEVSDHLNGGQRKVLLGLILAYGLGAVAVQPPTLFLTDYLHRDLGLRVSEASQVFSILGVGTAIGAGVSGLFAGLVGSRLTLFVVYVSGVISMLLVLFTSKIWALALAAGLAGVFLMGLVAMTSQRTMEAVGHAQHPKTWGTMTLAFALGLTVGSNGMSALLQYGQTYLDLFAIGFFIAFSGLVLTIFLSCRTLPSDQKNNINGSRV